MSKEILKLLIEKIRLMILILKIQFQVNFLKERITIPNLLGPKHIVLHHGGGEWDFTQVNNHHKDKWGFRSSLGFYAGYGYFIEYSGRLYQARRDNEEQAHCVEAGNPGYWNKNSIGICLQGNFEIERPTDAQLKTLKELLDRKLAEYRIQKYEIYSHNQISVTLCCGTNLIKWLKNYKNT